jgi:hypothetical protein
MSEQEKASDNLPKTDITRRATLTHAVAVAAFGAAMGMRAPTAWAQGKVEGKEEGNAGASKEEGNAGGKEGGNAEGPEEGKRKNWWRRHRHRRHHHRHHDDD